MGNTLVNLFKRWFGKQDIRILMVGLDAAGKTTVLYQLKLNEPISNTMPTIGFNVESVEYKNINFTKEVNFLFVGTRDSIDNAKMMLNYHLGHLEEVARIKKEKENLEQQLKTMGLAPQTGPSYLPSLAEMKSGPNVILSGLPTEPPRDRSYTTDSYAGDLNQTPEFTSNRNDEMEGPRIRTSSMGEGAIETRDSTAVKGGSRGLRGILEEREDDKHLSVHHGSSARTTESLSPNFERRNSQNNQRDRSASDGAVGLVGLRKKIIRPERKGINENWRQPVDERKESGFSRTLSNVETRQDSTRLQDKNQAGENSQGSFKRNSHSTSAQAANNRNSTKRNAKHEEKKNNSEVEKGPRRSGNEEKSAKNEDKNTKKVNKNNNVVAKPGRGNISQNE